MVKLIDLITEAITTNAIEKLIDKEISFSINYAGTEGIPKGWYRISPISTTKEDGIEYVNAYVFDKATKKPGTDQIRFQISKIVSQNIPTAAPELSSQIGDKIIDAVKNKRVVTIYYQGDEEIAAGKRDIEPVCYGSTENRLYLRAWQISDKASVSGDKGTAKTNWRFFRVDRISSFKVKGNETFNVKRPDFNEIGDAHMTTRVIAIADFKPDQTPVSSTITIPKAKAKKTKKVEPTPTTTGGTTTPTKPGATEPTAPVKPKSQHYASSRKKKDNDTLKEQLRESQMIESINEAIRIF